MDLEKLVLEKIEWAFSSFVRFVRENAIVILSVVLALSAIVSFVLVGYKESIGFSLQQHFKILLIPLSVYMVTSLILSSFVYKTHKKMWQSWIISNVLLFASFIYYLRVHHASILHNDWINLDTGLIFIPLGLMILILNLNLFLDKKIQIWVQRSIIFFYIFIGFSFADVILADRTSQRLFDIPWLDNLFSIPVVYWLALAGLLIPVVSTFNLSFKKVSNYIISIIISYIFVLQSFFIVYVISLGYFDGIGYWHKSLMTFIIWDYLQGPISTALKNDKDYRYKERLFINAFYHFLLILLVLFSPLIF